MISNKSKSLTNDEKVKKTPVDKINLQFEEIIKSVIEEQGYFKEKDVKPLMTTILNEIHPIIAKYVKQHFLEIGQFIINSNNSTESNQNGENKDAQTS